jgi:hypothetical protein
MKFMRRIPQYISGNFTKKDDILSGIKINPFKENSKLHY